MEAALLQLASDIAEGVYRHSPYAEFIVNDNKRRKIAVAVVRDRVVHRLLYEYLVRLYDKTFMYDVWSCRLGKGLEGAAERVQRHMHAYREGWLWRSDVTKFFDHIDHRTLMQLVRRRVSDQQALMLLDTVITSYHRTRHGGGADHNIGLAIGNLTSQICANIYLHEYDRFVMHMLKPLGYVRYGDDMVLWLPNEQRAEEVAERSRQFLDHTLHLTLNPGSTVLQPARKKLHYIGMEFWPSGHRLNARMRARLRSNASIDNYASYTALATIRGTRADRQALRQAILETSDMVY